MDKTTFRSTLKNKKYFTSHIQWYSKPKDCDLDSDISEANEVIQEEKRAIKLDFRNTSEYWRKLRIIWNVLQMFSKPNDLFRIHSRDVEICIKTQNIWNRKLKLKTSHMTGSD